MRKHHGIMRGLLMAAVTSLFNATLLAQVVVVEPIVEPDRPSVGYDKGYFLSHGDNYLLRVNGRLHTRAQYTYKDSSQHETVLGVPYARLLFGGHVFDPRVGFQTQLAFDNGISKLVEFYGNFGLVPDDLNLKVGYMLGNYSLLENYSTVKLALIDRSIVYRDWRIGTTRGLSFSGNKKNPFGYEVGVFDNDQSPISQKRRGGVSANLTFNFNEIDAGDEVDFQGGPLRAILSLGGFARAQVETWKLVGYAGAFEALAKFYGTSLNLGFFTGVPEAPAAAGSTPNNISQPLTKDLIGLAGYGQLGYLFDQKFGIAARYALLGDYKSAPNTHEILGAASAYFWDHNLKFQLDGGVNMISSKITPQIRAQLQLAF